jgi:hypothetical protein
MTLAPNSATRHLDLPEIGMSLEKVLCSSHFKDALQLQSLLRYIVENSINGQDDALKERIIGINVFGRKPDYETADDPIVRSRVGQLRRRLEHYYETAESEGSSVQIVIPLGTYRATFVLRPGKNGRGNGTPAMDLHPAAALDGGNMHPEPEATASAPKAPRKTRWRAWAILAAAAGAIFLTVWITTADRRKSEFDLFWGPVFESKKAVLIYTGPSLAYVPSASYEDKLRSLDPNVDLKLPMGRWGLPELAEGQVLTSKDLVLDKTAFAGSGELVACAKLAVVLATHHRTFDLRSDADLPFADLRESPAVLLGAYNNFWTMETTSALPFFYDRAMRIRERGGEGRVWSIVVQPGVPPPEEYLLVTRHFDSKTGSPVISISGITTCGTRAAGDFVTDPEQLAKLAGIPRTALERQNLAIVLHATFVDCIPTSMDIVAIKYW